MSPFLSPVLSVSLCHCGCVRVSVSETDASPTVPCDRYRLEWQWSSGVVAYYRDHSEGDTRPGCVSFTGSDSAPPEAFHSSCAEALTDAEFLCEMHSQPYEGETTSPVSPVSVPQVVGEISDATHVRCPDDHVTHTFLACDVRSACWAVGFGDSYSCDAPLTPLPPMFMCTDGLERVPYSLVCDFRSDCSDDSDEDFCVFRPCALDVAFHCENQQVG